MRRRIHAPHDTAINKSEKEDTCMRMRRRIMHHTTGRSTSEVLPVSKET